MFKGESSSVWKFQTQECRILSLWCRMAFMWDSTKGAHPFHYYSLITRLTELSFLIGSSIYSSLVHLEKN